jgi:hypothetical protein
MEMSVQLHAPRVEPPVPLGMRLGGPQSRSEPGGEKNPSLKLCHDGVLLNSYIFLDIFLRPLLLLKSTSVLESEPAPLPGIEPRPNSP